MYYQRLAKWYMECQVWCPCRCDAQNSSVIDDVKLALLTILCIAILDIFRLVASLQNSKSLDGCFLTGIRMLFMVYVTDSAGALQSRR